MTNILLPIDDIRRIEKTVAALEAKQPEAEEEVKLLLKGLLDSIESDTSHIVRTVSLPLVYQQAGVGLLHYVSRILAFRCPDVPVKVAIIHDESFVKLRLEVPENKRSEIEAVVEDYSAVLKGAKPLNQLLSQTEHLMELKQKLDLSALEIRITRDIIENPDPENMDNIETLEAEIRQFHQLIGRGLSQVQVVSAVITSLLEQERHKVQAALLVLQKKMDHVISESDEGVVKEALATILEHEPQFFNQIQDAISHSGTSGKIMDNLLSWASSLSTVMPR